MNILIVARPGMLQEGLSALLSTTPGIEVVSVTSDLDSALDYVSEHQPEACLIDLNRLGENQMNQFKLMRSDYPDMRTIALVGDVKTKELAQSLGFEEVFIKGTPSEKLIVSITDLVHETNTGN